MPSSGISASLLFGVQAVCHSFSILVFSKLKCSYSSSDPESLEAFALLRLFVLKTSFTVLATRAFRYLPSAGRFLTPWNLTQPTPPLQEFDQVDFMAMDCAIMALHYFVSCPGTCRGHTGKFFFFFLLASSSEGFAVLYDPLFCADLADWWRSLD